MNKRLTEGSLLLLGVFMVGIITIPHHFTFRSDPLFKRGFDIQGVWSYYEMRLQTNSRAIPTCIGTTNGFLKFDVKEDRYEYRIEGDNVDTHGDYFYETSSYPATVYFDDMDLTHWPVVNVRLNGADWLRLKVVNENCMMIFFWLDEHKVTITSMLYRTNQGYFKRPFYSCPTMQKYYRVEEGLNILDNCARENN